MTKALLLLGPTASGKTAVALHLARRFAVEIVSVDSAQVYRDMDVGTAKPSPEARAEIPHHLIDIVDPTEAYSAGRFRADALRLVAEISARGSVALLVGGTMLYFRALTRGLADLPVADPAIRAEIEARAARASWPVLHAELAKVDFATAARVEPNDAQRIQRALEVHRITGRTLSELQALRASEPPPFEALSLVLEPSDRAALHRRIDERFAGMLQEGLVEEVTDLRKRYRLEGGLPSMRSVGYRQVWETLEGEKPAATLAARGAAATRQLAKRQLTWLRSMGGAPHGDRIEDTGGAPNGDRIEHLERLDCLRPDLAEAVEARVARFLSRRRGT